MQEVVNMHLGKAWNSFSGSLAAANERNRDVAAERRAKRQAEQQRKQREREQRQRERQQRNEPAPDLATQFTDFCNTRPGISWLANAMDSVQSNLTSQGQGFTDLNGMLLDKFKSYASSNQGQKLAQQVGHEMSHGTLMIPVYLIEELIKQRSRILMRRHANRIMLFFGVRAAIASALVQLVKSGVRRLVNKRGGPKAKATMNFVFEALPTNFFGPLLGMAVGNAEMTSGWAIPVLPDMESGEGEPVAAGGAITGMINSMVGS